eukprot:6981719-Alexandrium_andersonii.AAC.1
MSASQWAKWVRQPAMALTHLPHDGFVELPTANGSGRLRWVVSENGEGEEVRCQGVVRVNEDSAADLLALSGREGVFLRLVATHRTGAFLDTAVEWVAKQQGETMHAYLERALFIAGDKPLTRREGGGAALGVVRAATDQDNRIPSG